MDTPTKFGGDTSRNAGVTTPFRERAIEERRLKDELLLSATPGLKRRSELQSDSGLVGNDPVEAKSYLRDLSAVLVLQDKRNLTEVLAQEDELPPAETLEVSDDVQESADVPVSDLRGAVFAELKLGSHRSKVRKILRPIVIEDTNTAHDEFELGSEELGIVEIGESAPEPTDVKLHDDDAYERLNSEEPAMEQLAPAAGFEEQESIVIDEMSLTDSEPEDLEPLPKFQIKQMLRPFIDREGVQLKGQSWTALQKASETLVKGIALELLDEEKRIVPDRQNILQAYKKFKVISPNSTNEALFEVCCKYLTLEDLNQLEASLFL